MPWQIFLHFANTLPVAGLCEAAARRAGSEIREGDTSALWSLVLRGLSTLVERDGARDESAAAGESRRNILSK